MRGLRNRIWGPVVVGCTIWFLGGCNTSSYVQQSVAMEPTLKVGDRLVVNMSAYAHSTPARWDIVLFKFPEGESGTLAVMRIIGLPGETVSTRGDEIILENNPVRSPPGLPTVTYRNRKSQIETPKVSYPFVIPEKTYFVLGDNSLHARDSRFWGVLPASEIIGKVVSLPSADDSPAK